MKKSFQLAALLVCWLAGMHGIHAQNQVSAGLDLGATLDLYSQSASPEDFESKLNQQENKVNNLDLDQDGQVDYLAIHSYQVGDAHALVIRAHLSKDQEQDVAVIEIEKQGKEEAIAQIVGLEDVFGEEMIVEPFAQEDRSVEKGPSSSTYTVRVVVNVWTWRSVRFLYRPAYRPWVSPWHFASYPRWWRPWRPTAHATYLAWHRPVRSRFHVVPTLRVSRAHRVYKPHQRRSSIQVHHKRTTISRAGGQASVERKSATIQRSRKGTKTNVTQRKTTARATGNQRKEKKVQRKSTKKKKTVK
ncbi:MAG: hypothetical protein KTR24_01970 [Saprospiraceae bacterium]|nr:hypothetical protein [Saprospiraceae bacterium]